jgi:hypothetical protein
MAGEPSVELKGALIAAPLNQADRQLAPTEALAIYRMDLCQCQANEQDMTIGPKILRGNSTIIVVTLSAGYLQV